MFQLVEEFNKEIVGIERETPQLLEPKEFDWLIGALKEEVGELEEATNLTEQVDALIDLMYFASGGLTRMGIDHTTSRKIFEVVHNANMQKARGKKEGRAIQIDLDASKPEGWKAPDETIRELLGQ